MIPFKRGNAQKNGPRPTNLVTFTEEIINGKLHFLCSESYPEYKEGNQKLGIFYQITNAINSLFNFYSKNLHSLKVYNVAMIYNKQSRVLER